MTTKLVAAKFAIWLTITALMIVIIWHHAHWSVTVVLSYALLRFNVEDVLEDMKEVRMKDFVTKYGPAK
jgi:phosphate starvation-inducible membrane PsiE